MTDTDTCTVTLLRDGHEHQGRPCAAGDAIVVTAAERDWLTAQGLIAPLAPSKSTRTVAQE